MTEITIDDAIKALQAAKDRYAGHLPIYVQTGDDIAFYPAAWMRAVEQIPVGTGAQIPKPFIVIGATYADEGF
jgi:hypothetical protein